LEYISQAQEANTILVHIPTNVKLLDSEDSDQYDVTGRKKIMGGFIRKESNSILALKKYVESNPKLLQYVYQSLQRTC
jgi:hypothetical protein